MLQEYLDGAREAVNNFFGIGHCLSVTTYANAVVVCFNDPYCDNWEDDDKVIYFSPVESADEAYAAAYAAVEAEYHRLRG